jgi:hypothetical protein
MSKELKKRVANVTEDQLKVYEHTKELVLQAFHSCMVRDIVKENRYKRAAEKRSYNAINSFSHVALENYALLQLWKLFDEKNSVFNVRYAVEHMPHPALKSWFTKEIGLIKNDIEYVCAWRHNFVGHRSEIVHFAPEEFQKAFSGVTDSEPRVKEFLLNLLCKMKLEMQGIPMEKTMVELCLELQGYATFLQDEKVKALK